MKRANDFYSHHIIKTNSFTTTITNVRLHFPPFTTANKLANRFTPCEILLLIFVWHVVY